MKHITRDVLFAALISISTLSLLGMLYMPYLKKEQTSKSLFPLIHVVPTDAKSLQELDLCPLFVKQEEFSIDPELLQEMRNDFLAQGISPQDVEKQLEALRPVEGLKCHIFNSQELEFEERIVPVDSPCVVSLGQFNGCERSLIQYKSLDQFELAQKTSLSPALCAGHALNNARFLSDYLQTGEIKNLVNLHDLEKSTNFLLNLNINDWVNVDVVKENIVKMGSQLGVDVSSISAISSVGLFDSQLIDKPEFSLVSEDEFDYVQKLKTQITLGLKQKYYMHILIVGNEEFAQEHGHYFAFALIKSEGTVQYVVIDTMPNVYHLQDGSHERDRLMFVIDNIEQGGSSVDLANIRSALLRAMGAFD